MTIYDYVAISLLILTIFVNSSLVYLQKTRNIYKRFDPHAYGWHGFFISIFWGAFIISEFVANKSTWRLDHSYVTAGLTIMGLALAIFSLAIKEIGLGGLGNANFFGAPLRKLSGIYNYISEPIYWSYSLWFLGIGLASGLKVFFVITAISIVGLVGIESYVERPKK